VAQVVEHLPSNDQVLSQTQVLPKKKKRVTEYLHKYKYSIRRGNKDVLGIFTLDFSQKAEK
jgi:hypothetical protein